MFDNVVVVVVLANVVVVVEVVGADLPRRSVTVMTDGTCEFPELAILTVGESLV